MVGKKLAFTRVTALTVEQRWERWVNVQVCDTVPLERAGAAR
jgi:hypothetical protein